jgi:hypothetical protein
MRKFILQLLAPKVVQIGDVLLTRDGKAYWVQPGQLVQMRVIPVHKVKESK